MHLNGDDMRKGLSYMFVTLLTAALVALVGCDMGQGDSRPVSLTVSVADARDAKTIGPAGQVDVTHYDFTVSNAAEGLVLESGPLPKGALFTVSDIPAGSWTVEADALVEREEGMLKVAHGGPVTVEAAPGQSAEVTIVIDKVLEELSGPVMVTVNLPMSQVGVGSQVGWTASAKGLLQNDGRSFDTSGTATAAADGSIAITLDSEELGIVQGAWALTLSVDLPEGMRTITVALRLLAGLEARGSLDLSWEEPESTGVIDVTFTDSIHDMDEVSLTAGSPRWLADDGVWALDVSASSDAGTAGMDVIAFIDGVQMPTDPGRTVELYDSSVSVTSTATADGWEFRFHGLRSGRTYVASFMLVSDELGGLAASTSVSWNVAASVDDILITRTKEVRIGTWRELAERTHVPDGFINVGFIRDDESLDGLTTGTVDFPYVGAIPEYMGEAEAMPEDMGLVPVNIPIGEVFPDWNPDTGETGNASSSWSGTVIKFGGGVGCIGSMSNASNTTAAVGSRVTDVILPDGLERIGHGAFSGRSGLETANLPSTLVEVGNRAFYNCTGLSGALDLPDGIMAIGYGAWYGCGNLTSLELPASLRTIGDGVSTIGAFQNCTGLTGTLALPEGLEVIGPNSFYGCRGLVGGLTIPSSMTSIGQYAFRYCEGLASLTLPEEPKFTVLTGFTDCTGLSNELVIPEGITEIGAGAFSGCTGLTGSLVMPSTLKRIGSDAFSRCQGIEGTLTLNDGLVEIGGYAFYECQNMTGDIIIPDTVEKLGAYAFYWCQKMTGRIHLSTKLTEIPDCCFYVAKPSGPLVIPDGVTRIGKNAFYACYNTTYAWIPASVTVIETSLDYDNSTAIQVDYDAYCEAASQPEGFEERWYISSNGGEVLWGQTWEAFVEASGYQE